MKFRYKKYASSILRPVIPIEIVSGERKIRYEVLIDSGADVNIFHASLAPILGINLFKGEEKSVGGINVGKPEPYWVHSVDLIIGGHKHKKIKQVLKN